MILISSIKKLMNKKVDKKNNLFSIFNDYINVANELKSIKDKEKMLEIKKIQNQIEEYYIPLSSVDKFVDLNSINENSIVDKVKHISEIKPENFSFVELYACPTKDGVLLSTTKLTNSELIRIVSYKKVSKQ
jgi:hypothetical protein